MSPLHPLLGALHFAARKHRDQRRKDADASPYINHPIEVAEILAGTGVDDLVTLQGAVLHDTVEDTQTTPEELLAAFGPEVRDVVLEVTDDKRLPKHERKRLQIEHAPHLTARARQIKIADKISNVRAIATEPPKGWSEKQRREYLDWADRVVQGCRGLNGALESMFDEALAAGRQALAIDGAPAKEPRGT